MKKILGVLVLLFVLVGCVKEGPTEMRSVEYSSEVKAELEKLADVEVQDYEGKRLDSVSAFRENSIKGVQEIDVSNYQLEITGLVNEPKNYTYDEVLAFDNYEKVVTLYCVEGWDARVLWEGVLLRDILDASSVKDSGNTVVFYAYDGYTSTLPLEYFYDNAILLAYKINNMTLPDANGFPFQLVAEDKWGYKWVRWITKIEVTDDPTQKGFWEARGYNQDGSLDGPVFE